MSLLHISARNLPASLTVSSNNTSSWCLLMFWRRRLWYLKTLCSLLFISTVVTSEICCALSCRAVKRQPVSQACYHTYLRFSSFVQFGAHFFRSKWFFFSAHLLHEKQLISYFLLYRVLNLAVTHVRRATRAAGSRCQSPTCCNNCVELKACFCANTPLNRSALLLFKAVCHCHAAMSLKWLNKYREV